MSHEPLLHLGRYLLKRRLAVGGMGEVYLGEVQGAANFTKAVAIKRILPHLASNQSFVSKFIDEANVMVQLHHGNIVPVLELADQGGELFIVMEYLPGRDLKSVLARAKSQRRPFPIDLALWVAAEMADGLDYAHRKTGTDGLPLNIVHRDISPSNVVLGAAGEVKLVDFGIARVRGSLHQSVSGTLQGKFVYMSPEQAEGVSVDARTDVFSCGLVLYEMLTGVRPFEGETETETLRRVRVAVIPKPSTHRAELDSRLDELLGLALAAARTERYDSAGALRHALATYLAGVRSPVDARSMSRFLAELYPEGVVPSASEPGPRSMDDALKLQLGALTPSAAGLGQTRTATGPAGQLRAGTPAFAATSGPGAAPQLNLSTPQSQVSALSTATSAPERRRRRLPWFALGVLLTSVVSAVLWFQTSRVATLDVSVTPVRARDVELTVNGAPFDHTEEFGVGARVEVCARARDFKPRCKTAIRVKTSENTVVLALEPKVTLVTFRATPASTRVVVEGKPEPFTQGTPQNLELVEKVKVVYEAEGHQTLVKSYDLFTLNDDRTLIEQLVPTVGSVPAPPSGVDPASAPGPEGFERAAANRARLLELRSSPEGATVTAGPIVVGRTPVSLAAPRVDTTYVFRSPGHREQSLRVHAFGTTAELVTLEALPPGFVSVRVAPAAGTLLLDGRDLGTHVLTTRAVPAGDHVLMARFQNRETTRKITVEAGVTLELPPMDLTRPEDETEPDEEALP